MVPAVLPSKRWVDLLEDVEMEVMVKEILWTPKQGLDLVMWVTERRMLNASTSSRKE